MENDRLNPSIKIKLIQNRLKLIEHNPKFHQSHLNLITLNNKSIENKTIKITSNIKKLKYQVNPIINKV